ncbi:manganese efflux pump MntP family protein [Tepidamorphus sp. 3E244]|uniref:manganese efflux pump MntP n=1 Tax=Tepidamorphus sp. 3E244 TaxID=3385498 RepID=UPI0038FC22F5
MTFGALLLVALALSTDAFAVSLARGASGRFATYGSALRTGAMFGLAEGAMVALGLLLASSFRTFVEEIDHWFALFLLVAIGGRMIYAGLTDSGESEDEPDNGPAKRPSLLGNLVTVLGTSIDACAVGIALAFADVSGLFAALIIGCVSFAVATTGLLIAPRVGKLLGPHAETVGGIVLAAIGVYIFVTHSVAAETIIP